MADEPDVPPLSPLAPEGTVYRIARAPTPWSWPDWANVGKDQTFGNRWDDPEGVFRVLYASSGRLGAFVEVLSRSTTEGHRRFAGITYLSRLGDEFRNWALFEPVGEETPFEEESEALPIAPDDPDLNEALELLGIRLVGL